MIPKVIHYCWFSEGEKPDKIKHCIDSWHKLLPDFEKKCWNYQVFPRGKSKWVDQAVDEKKYAFAADYIRSYALFHEGGVYLDSDVEVLKDLSPLLSYHYFIGCENEGIWEAAVMGAEPGMLLYSKLLEYYNARDFKTKNSLDVKPLPRIMSEIGRKEFNIRNIDSFEQYDPNSQDLQIVPFDYFSPKSYKTGKISITDRTYTVHHFTASWHGKKEYLYKLVSHIMGRKIAALFSKLYKQVSKK